MELETKNAELHKKSREIEIKEATESTLRLAEEVDDWNSMEITLSRYSKTTPIFDAFFNSDYKFLIIEHAYVLSQDTSCGYVDNSVSLIIIKRKDAPSRVSVYDSGLTMTDLKLSINDPYTPFEPSNPERERRLWPLEKELKQLDLTQYSKGDCVPFQNICYLGAQTYSNQTGFGSEYRGAELVYEGTLYGETTGFLIIGVRFESNPYPFF